MKVLLLKAVKKGEKIEDGAFTARLEYGGRYPSWKDEFVKELGEEAAESVIANTPRVEMVVVEAVEPANQG